MSQVVAATLRAARSSNSVQPRRIRGVPSVKNRIHPSEQISDDVIEYMKQSLEPYKGCTIIDYNPGLGIWSQKLHDYLKPTLHVLSDSHWNRFHNQLDPLVQQPGSKFVKQPEAPGDHWSPDPFVSAGLLPPEDQHGPHKKTLLLVNATSLTARGGGDSAYKNTSKPCNLWAYRYARECRERKGFHARGPTRMLMWCEDDAKFNILPRRLERRHKLAVFLEAQCHVHEVAGFMYDRFSKADAGRRDPAISRSSAARAMRHMEAARLEPPKGRLLISASDTASTSEGDFYERAKGQYNDLVVEFAAGKHACFEGDDPAPITERALSTVRTPRDRESTSAYKTLLLLRKYGNSHLKAQQLTQSLLEEHKALDRLDLQSYSSDISPFQREQMLTEYDLRSEALVEKLKGLPPGRHRAKMRFLRSYDNNHAFYNSAGPLMQWDRRPYEPLLVEGGDLQPPGSEASLLDFHDKGNDATAPIDPDIGKLFEELAGECLHGNSHRSDLSLLNNMAPGAFEALVTRNSEITDARKGGRRNPRLLRNYSLTPGMILELARQWHEWPFKPDNAFAGGSKL